MSYEAASTKGLFGSSIRSSPGRRYSVDSEPYHRRTHITGQYLTDTVTALKLFPRPLLNELHLQTTGFELDHEITSKVLARGCRIVEVPIQYFPRSRDQGKKIGGKDWIRGLRTFWRFRQG